MKIIKSNHYTGNTDFIKDYNIINNWKCPNETFFLEEKIREPLIINTRKTLVINNIWNW